MTVNALTIIDSVMVNVLLTVMVNILTIIDSDGEYINY